MISSRFIMPSDNSSCPKPVMTKLMQWLLGATIFFSFWVSIVTGQWKTSLTQEWMHLIIPFPLIAILMFGVYAGVVVLWRVYTFNDCEEAAKELLEQISEAKEDLKRKGMKFEEVSK
ncbi:dolichol-phosphate mannosyltransferase subunit 3 [Ischnura elegans]|uniref:dolichol-phosphate mannosyltransferase subunit 3 n=1 Tax=Ischnura elegans TaxID=197161 RepID=UPI001ED8B289|nr:dolichol-phosphate mannosyltransferase subunit 3 [Ischnura elegans]